jgi:hypothetical protein
MFRLSSRSNGGVGSFCAFLLLAVGVNARAEEVETREFAAKIDGNPVGHYRMTITRKDDGNVTMAGQADLRMTKLGITTFHYTYRGTEVWSSGRLVSFQSNTDDDGTKYTVLGNADRGGLRLKVNGVERMVRPDVWITSYWQLPEARRRNGSVPLLDADDGKTLAGAIRRLGIEPITVAGQSLDCAHYRITGPNMVDAWYDGQDRLVRQEWTEKGHKVQMELTQLQR